MAHLCVVRTDEVLTPTALLSRAHDRYKVHSGVP